MMTRMSNRQVSKMRISEMINFIEKHPEMNQSYNNTSKGRKINIQLWEKLTDKLNSLGLPGRSVREWRRIWVQRKHKLKKKIEKRKTDEDVKLTPEEERIMEITNFEIAIAAGHENVSTSFGAPITISDDDILPSTSQSLRSGSVTDSTVEDEIPVTETKQPKQASKVQISEMIKFMEEHPEMCQTENNTSQGRQIIIQLWKTLADQLNSLGLPNKSATEWRRVWIQRKHKLKKKLSDNRFLNEEVTLTAHEARIMEVANFGIEITGIESVPTFGDPIKISEDDILPSTSSSKATRRSSSMTNSTVEDDIPVATTKKRKNSSQGNSMKKPKKAVKLEELYVEQAEKDRQYRERKLLLQEQILKCLQKTMECQQETLRTMKECNEKTESFQDCALEMIAKFVFQQHRQSLSDED